MRGIILMYRRGLLLYRYICVAIQYSSLKALLFTHVNISRSNNKIKKTLSLTSCSKSFKVVKSKSLELGRQLSPTESATRGQCAVFFELSSWGLSHRMRTCPRCNQIWMSAYRFRCLSPWFRSYTLKSELSAPRPSALAYSISPWSTSAAGMTMTE